MSSGQGMTNHPVAEVRTLFAIAELSHPQKRLPHLKDYFNEVSAILAREFPIHYSALILRDPKKDSLFVEACFGQGIEGIEGHPRSCEVQQGAIGKALQCQEPVVIRDLAREPLYEAWVKGRGETIPIRIPLLCFPLIGEESPLGVINIEPPYGQDKALLRDLQFLQAVAALLAPMVKSYQEKKAGPLARHESQKLRFPGLEDVLSERVGELLNKIDPYAKTKAGADLFDDVVRLVERILIKSALERVNYVQVAAAELLGINRNTLRKKIKDLKIKLP